MFFNFKLFREGRSRPFPTEEIDIVLKFSLNICRSRFAVKESTGWEENEGGVTDSRRKNQMKFLVLKS